MPRTVPNVCTEVSHKVGRGFIRFNLTQIITRFFHKLRVVCTSGIQDPDFGVQSDRYY